MPSRIVLLMSENDTIISSTANTSNTSEIFARFVFTASTKSF